MSSIALKFTTLAIRTLSKPIANYIKRQAREHPVFRATCVNFAQTIHRVDVRWRIGLLQDAAALERQAKRDAAKEAAKKQKASTPTVKTEAQTKADEAAESAEAKADEDAAKAEKDRPQPKVKPLSEAKAIETGANFISETFLFSVAASLILFESWRSRRKASERREDMKDRLDDLEVAEKAARRALIELEREVLQLRAKHSTEGNGAVQQRILPKEVYEPPKDESSDDKVTRTWLTRIASYISLRDDQSTTDEVEAREALATNSPGPAEKILKDSDRALDEKHRQQAAEEAARAAAAAAAAAAATPTKKTTVTEDSLHGKKVSS